MFELAITLSILQGYLNKVTCFLNSDWYDECFSFSILCNTSNNGSSYGVENEHVAEQPSKHAS